MLLSHPALRDPSFRRTIVFLPNHDVEGGAFGLIINRPTSEVLADFLVEPPASAVLSEVPVFTGGPVGTDELTLAAFSFAAGTDMVSCQTHLSLDEAEAMKSGGESIFFFKQKTAYEIGLGIPAEPLFRSRMQGVEFDNGDMYVDGHKA